MRSKSKQIFSLLVLLAILIIPQLFLPTKNIGSNSIGKESKINEHETFSITDSNPNKSDTTYFNNKYNLSNWWNTTFRYRICIELEENCSVTRHQPIDVYLRFQENEHHINSTRLVSYNATGNNEWSQPLTIQIWNITKYYLTNYIQSFTITFIANVSANSNQIYFLYYNDNMEGIEIPYYNTNFSSVLNNGILNVSIGQTESNLKVLIEENYGISKLEKAGINFHTKDSLTPEKQLSNLPIELILHCDEGSGGLIHSSSNNEFIGELIGNTKWTNGRVDNCIEFDGYGDYISFDDILNFPFGSTSKEFTITAWIKPNKLSSNTSNHGIMNCFMAKASEPYNDNLELGIYRYNDTHGYLQVYIETVLKSNISSIYGNISNNPILINEWNFIAVKYFEGNVDIQINNIVYTKDIYNNESWSGSKYLNQASGSYFTLGATIDGNTFYNGSLDEVVIYNSSLSNNDINQFKLAKSKSSIESIIELENGIIFSRYKILWKQIFDMHIEDIITFYNDYNLWNIYRCIYFDNKFNPDQASMNALNTYYNLSEIYNQKEGKYYYDNIVGNNLTSSGFIAENYSIIYTPNPFNISVGFFIAEYEVSDIIHSSVSELKGNVAYYNNITEFTPGAITDFDNNNGGSNFKLYLDFWEFIDKFNQSGMLNDNDLLIYFNNTLNTLRNPINIYVYHQESLFFKLIVHIEDIDNNPVNQATISIYNLTVNGDTDQLILDQKTNLDGNTTFLYLKNGTYTVNVTYEKYGQPIFQIIKHPINITINEIVADKFGRVFHSFYKVNLTSVKMQVRRIDPNTHQIKEFAVNTNVSFWINDGTGNRYVGYELTDSSGIAKFQWKNFTSANEGNITFAISWYDTILNISCENENIIKANPTNITLYFYKEIIITVNLSSYKFSSALVESITESVYIGDEITFQVNYSYTINYTNPIPIENASINYYIQHENLNISSMLIQFNETTIPGTYSTTINTSKPDDPNIELIGGNTYIMMVHASKPGYIPITTSILFELLPYDTNLTINNYIYEICWGDNISLNVYYENIYFFPNSGLEGALVNFSIVNYPNINGSLIFNGTAGWYKIELNSSIFISFGNFEMKIQAYKKNFQIISIIIILKIIPRKIDFILSNKFSKNIINIYSGDNLEFDIQINDSSNKYPIIGAQVSLNVLEKNNYSLFDNGYGSYSLNILRFDILNNPEQYKIYKSNIIVIKANYSTKIVPITIIIVIKELDYQLSATNLDKHQITIPNGENIKFKLKLRDPTKSYILIKSASIIIDINEKKYKFEEISDGIYEYNFYTDEFEGFTQTHTLKCKIYINSQNFIEEEIELIIIISLEEIYPSIPTFYFINAVMMLCMFISILFGYLKLKNKNIINWLKKIIKKIK